MPTKKISKKTVVTKKTQSSHTTKKTGDVKTVKAVTKSTTKAAQPVRSLLNPVSTSGTAAKKAPLKGARSSRFQKIKDILLQQKAALLSEAEVALNELPGQSAFPDMGDQASAETDTNFMLRLRGREQRLLKKIEEALERIDNNTFGICDDCGLEIDVKRLEARPVTTMCIECKIHQEEDEKRREV